MVKVIAHRGSGIGTHENTLTGFLKSISWGVDCIECDVLSLCHGGCPVRTYSVEHTIFEKDPHCGLYKSMFSHMKDAATRMLKRSDTHFDPVESKQNQGIF